MKNKLGLLNFARYFFDLNDIPTDRNIPWEKFNGRKTLRDSFKHQEKIDERSEQMDGNDNRIVATKHGCSHTIDCIDC